MSDSDSTPHWSFIVLRDLVAPLANVYFSRTLQDGSSARVPSVRHLARAAHGDENNSEDQTLNVDERWISYAFEAYNSINALMADGFDVDKLFGAVSLNSVGRECILKVDALIAPPALHRFVDDIYNLRSVAYEHVKSEPAAEVLSYRTGQPDGTFVVLPGFLDTPHGWLESRSDFINEFAPNHNLYIVGWGDFGTLYEMAYAVFCALKNRREGDGDDIQSVSIIGFSMGGAIAQILATLIMDYGPKESRLILQSVILLCTSTNSGKGPSTMAITEGHTEKESRKMLIRASVSCVLKDELTWRIKRRPPNQRPYPVLSVAGQSHAFTSWMSQDCEEDARRMDIKCLRRIGRERKIPILVVSSTRDTAVQPVFQNEAWCAIMEGCGEGKYSTLKQTRWGAQFIRSDEGGHCTLVTKPSVIQAMNEWKDTFVDTQPPSTPLQLERDGIREADGNWISSLKPMSEAWIDANESTVKQLIGLESAMDVTLSVIGALF